MSEGLRKTLAELRGRLERSYGGRLKGMMLYGSHSRGEASEDSDVDVLVVLTGPVNGAEEISRTIDDVSDLSLRNNVVLGCLFVSQEEYQQEQSPLLLNVRREGLPI